MGMHFVGRVETAILKDLIRKPMYSYIGMVRDAPIKSGSMYYNLTKLINKGCVTSRPVNTSRRVKLEYTITYEGRVIYRAIQAAEAAYEAEMQAARQLEEEYADA